MRVDCDCGFSGTLKPENGYGKCFGCDRVYQEIDGKVQPMSNEIPTFKNVEEMMAFAAKVPAKGKVQGSSSKSQKKRTTKRKPVEKDTAVIDKPEAPTYKTIHFYVRPGDSWEQVLKDCRQETGFAGPGTLVFAHNHEHGKPCSDSCRGI